MREGLYYSGCTSERHLQAQNRVFRHAMQVSLGHFPPFAREETASHVLYTRRSEYDAADMCSH